MTRAIVGARSVHCGGCRARLGDLEDGPQVVPVAERGGAFRETVRVERVLRLLRGYLPRQPDGVWTFGNHARKRLLRGKPLAFNHGDVRNGVVEYPARVECYQCSREVIVLRPQSVSR